MYEQYLIPNKVLESNIFNVHCTTGKSIELQQNKFVVELYARGPSPYPVYIHNLGQLLIDKRRIERFYMSEKLLKYNYQLYIISNLLIFSQYLLF